ncbi:hypothetical protein, partial [Aegicerativicinus sediminis]
MYTFSNRLKSVAIGLIIIGAIGVIYGFLTSHKTFEEVEAILSEEAAHHEGGHDAGSDHAVMEDHATMEHATAETHAEDTHQEESVDSSHAVAEEVTHTDETVHAAADHSEEHSDMGAASEHHADEHTEHVEHVQHQIANRPWAALYVAAFFFFMIALGALAFYAIQYASQAGWSPMVLRVMEGITSYVLPGGAIVLAIAVASGTIGHYNLFVWMDPEVVAHDKLLQGKSGYLSLFWFVVRGVIFLGGWSLYRHFSRKFSLAQDEASDNKNFIKNFRISAAFLVFYIYTESMMSWDWIMSTDPHWFSTLFGWYVFASMFVSGITVIAMITMYLKSKGLLPLVNDSHLHDLAKFMFAISIFWTYLWFSQFMLIWYSNIPEEVTYFVSRFNDYKLPFLGMLVMNFVFPLLILMNSDYKRIPWFVVMAGIVILAGHYIDVFNMIMPATVGDRWYIGIPEIGSILLFGGLFLFIVFT